MVALTISKASSIVSACNIEIPITLFSFFVMPSFATFTALPSGLPMSTNPEPIFFFHSNQSFIPCCACSGVARANLSTTVVGAQYKVMYLFIIFVLSGDRLESLCCFSSIFTIGRSVGDLEIRRNREQRWIRLCPHDVGHLKNLVTCKRVAHFTVDDGLELSGRPNLCNRVDPFGVADLTCGDAADCADAAHYESLPCLNSQIFRAHLVVRRIATHTECLPTDDE